MGYGGFSYGSSPLGGAAAATGFAESQDLTLTLSAPVVRISGQAPLQALTLTLLTPTPKMPIQITTLTLTLNAPVTIVSSQAATLPLTLTLYTPSLFISSTAKVSVNGLTLRTSLYKPRVVRYIKDPIRSGGCPQCGTFLYQEYGATVIKSEPVLYGRSFDIEGEDKFFKCSRCNWLVKPKRTPPHRKGSYTGWGLRYDEVEAGR